MPYNLTKYKGNQEGLISRAKQSTSHYLSKLPLFRPKKQRLIIEGSFQDDWGTFYLDRMRYHISSDVNCIKIAQYSLELVANAFLDIEAASSVSEKRALELPYDYFFGIQRPTTIITEDGRLFHDIILLEDDGWNKNRLPAFLRGIRERYGRKSDFIRVFERKQIENP